MIGAWITKIQRHPTDWTIGPPSATPSTGPPAPTRDHQPSTLVRSSGGKTRKSNDHDAAVVHAPSMPDRRRAPISQPTPCALAVSTAHSSAPLRPNR